MGPRNAAYDVAIIGAGPAGSAAAIGLARAGRRTIVIEKKQFPREKVCGGCLSGPATTCLQELLGTDRPLPGVCVARITFVIGRYRIVCRANGATRMVPRAVLDTCLADTAAAAGAEVRYGEAATLTRGEAGWNAVVGGETIRARTILVACGLSGLPFRLGIPDRNGHRRLIGQMWFQPAEPPLPDIGCAEMHWLRGGYVGLATPSADHCVVAMVADAQEHAGGNPLERLRQRNPDAEIWHTLPADAPRRYHAAGIAGFPWRPDRLGVDNVLLIGDAAGFEEPYSGEGIGQAMRSAACAVRAVLSDAEPLAYYTALMGHRHCLVMRRTRFVRRVLDLPLIHYLAGKAPIVPPEPFAQLMRTVHLKGAI